MKILVGIDGSESSQKALQQSLRLMRQNDVSYILLAVEEPVVMTSASPVPGVLGASGAIAWQEEGELLQIQKQRLEQALQTAETLCQQAGVTCSCRSELGSPKQTICEVAQQENCDLIVVGSHGYRGLQRIMMGSVSDHVVRHAHCAVLVMRESNELRPG
jgi:nucleotide-binding universal stress UspA family protein